MNADPQQCRQVEPLAGDGSDRRFYRLRLADNSTLVAVQPAAGTQGLAEARAAVAIGRHLAARDVPVPIIHAFDQESGLLLCEDLGDTLLHEAAGRATPAERLTLYRQAVALLAHMQVAGGRDFEPAWCWDTPRYDRQLMLSRESGYFVRAFCQNYLGIDKIEDAVTEEFEALAEQAAAEPADYFLHRDFQSRNLMLHQGRLRVIDFQGGRLGPLAYDLASLLLDPYAGLPRTLQAELLEHYLDCLTPLLPLDRPAFLQGYYRLALQRNLQIIGAFAFLYREKQKKFFHAFLRPALASLHEQLALPAGADYPCLRKLVADCLRLMEYRSQNPEARRCR